MSYRLSGLDAPSLAGPAVGGFTLGGLTSLFLMLPTWNGNEWLPNLTAWVPALGYAMIAMFTVSAAWSSHSASRMLAACGRVKTHRHFNAEKRADIIKAGHDMILTAGGYQFFLLLVMLVVVGLRPLGAFTGGLFVVAAWLTYGLLFSAYDMAASARKLVMRMDENEQSAAERAEWERQRDARLAA